jgi:tyrosyl-tRNA synthetase
MRDQLIAHELDERPTDFVLRSEFQVGVKYQLDLHRLELKTTLDRAQRAMVEIQGVSYTLATSYTR